VGLEAQPSDPRAGVFDQENIFTPATDTVKTAEAIMRAGMTLDEFGGLLAAHRL
jgi:glutathione-S-conjugate glycine hydrolase